ncbi:odorant receptor 13a-like [Leptopilina boulardi]|uniref:odorant receptor 13a-like n=1 Tax=Leptopilina boulardi TaxID=63433 RepID=UPI0021F63750|nr:odorant receptor 13a-like [Leptopilina boulardi]
MYIAMVEVFEIRYYQINKFLLSLIGQWPFQSTIKARIFFFIMLIFVLSQLFLQVTSTYCYWPDMDMFIESGSPILIAGICAAKISNFIINSRKMKKLLLKMQSHWMSLNDSSEIEILKNYTIASHKMTLLYMRIVYSALTVFMIVPTLQSIAENVLPGRNQTYPLPFPIDNIVNVEKYHKILLIHSFISTYYFITVYISADTMFLTYATHGCGMFAVLGNQLKNVSLENNEESSKKPDDEIYRKFLKYIKNHVEVLNFVELLESTYSTTFLFQTGINVISISVTGMQIVLNIDNPDQVMRCMTNLSGQIIQLYINSLPCQRIIDHSFSIRDAVYSSPWYLFPKKIRPLIHIILMRVITPCQITAGKLYIMSMENFGMVLKTSMSYFTVLLSMR